MAARSRIAPVALATLVAAPAGAVEMRLSVSGASVGARSSRSATVVDSTHTAAIETSSGAGGGLRLGLFGYPLGVELALSGSSVRHVVRLFDSALGSPGEPAPEVSVVDTDSMYLAMGELVLDPVPGPVRPFLAVGTGAALLVDEAAFTYSFGGGVLVRVTRRLALRVDLRRYQARLRNRIDQVDDVLPDGTYVGRRFAVPATLRLDEVGASLVWIW